MQDSEKDGAVDGADKSFQSELREAIQKHYDEYPDGDVYHLMRDVFDREIAVESMKRIPKVRFAAKRCGVAYTTFRKMLKKKQ